MHPEGTPAQAAGLPQPGQTLGGKYEIVRLLGEGGMAFVYEASHKRLEQRVAIKLLTPEFARDPELVKRFEREARAVARLRTKHVARVIDVEETPEGVPYIVMEFLEGRDLDAELEARTQLPVGEAVDIVLQACAGMLEAHGLGIVHRDLKPANLFLATSYDPDSHRNPADARIVKVLDFGISKVVGEATRLTGAGAVMGTVLYMSPEQIRAQPNVDTRADIWALGVILYELLAGRAPWEGHSHQIAAAIVSRDPPALKTFVQVPDALAAVVSKMLQREPERRFANVREVAAALAPFAPPGSIGARVAEQISLGQSSSRRVPTQAMPPVSMKHTVPMASRPGAGLEAPPSVEGSRLAASAPTPARGSLPGLDAEPAPRSRLVLVVVVMLGLLGMGALVFLVVRARHPQPTPPPTLADDASATIAKSAEPPPSATLVPAISAAPPATGTAGRTSSPVDSSPRMTPALPPSGKRSPGSRSSSSSPAPTVSVATPPLTL